MVVCGLRTTGLRGPQLPGCLATELHGEHALVYSSPVSPPPGAAASPLPRLSFAPCIPVAALATFQQKKESATTLC